MNDKMTELAEQQSLQEIPVEISESKLSGAAVQANSLMENTKLMNTMWKFAGIYAKSLMIPTNYQGKPENCFVAIELAERMDVSPVLVMQNLIVVQGRPSWNGQACIALINGCGKFAHDLDFVTTGTPNTDDWGCYCKTVRKYDDKELFGTEITMRMANDEGWLNKSGSKWKTMPAQMLMYRAASFFARSYCPEVLMGFSTADEAEDIAPESQTTTIRV